VLDYDLIAVADRHTEGFQHRCVRGVEQVGDLLIGAALDEVEAYERHRKLLALGA
jgi:hypothetical protein